MKSPKNQRGKVKRMFCDIFLLVVTLTALNHLIETLKALPDPEKRERIYEVARAEMVKDQEEISDDEVAVRSIDEVVYSLSGNFSAYNNHEDQTDSDPDIMASNKKVYEGAIACPDKLIFKDGRRAFGTKIEIEGLGVFTCEDRMAKRYREMDHFDIFLFSEKEAFTFGRQQLKYRILL